MNFQTIDSLSWHAVALQYMIYETYLKAEAKKMDNGDHKLLLLGPGSTGKSTLFKSLLHIYI